MAERLLPHNTDAEKVVLGAVLVSADLLDAISPVVRPRDFYALAHGVVFAAMLDVWRRGEPLDRISVVEELRRNGALEKVGGAPYIAMLVGSVQTASSAVHYAKLVREKARLRAIVMAAKRISAVAYDGESDPDGAAARASAILRSATDDLAVPALRPLAEVTETYAARMASVPTFRTPWPSLDRLTGGFTADELVVWASDPGVGKSFALAQLAAYVAEHYGNVAYFTTEMGEWKTLQRFVALFSGVSARRQREGTQADRSPGTSGEKPFSRGERQRIQSALVTLRRFPIFLSDETMSADDLVAQCRRLHRISALSAVFIDTLGALSDVVGHSGPGRDPGTHERQKRVVWMLKSLAKELGIPVHVAHHFSREAPVRGVPAAPSKGRLRDGGGLENTATTIILPYRETIVEKERGHGGREWTRIEYFWKIDKARDGNEMTLPMNFLGAQAMWTERDQDLASALYDDGEPPEPPAIEREPEPEQPQESAAVEEPTDLLEYAAARCAAS